MIDRAAGLLGKTRTDFIGRHSNRIKRPCPVEPRLAGRILRRDRPLFCRMARQTRGTWTSGTPVAAVGKAVRSTAGR
nr:hypothetical protein [Rhizobium sullae]